MQNFNLWETDCWDGYKKAGMKKGKGGKMVNNCVPEEDETNEARVAPSADTQARLTKNMDRSSAADLKRALNNNVDGLDALAWKLQYQFAGVDPKAITELKAVYKQALKMQKSVAKSIDGAK